MAAGRSRELKVTIVGDASGVKKAFGQAEKSGRGLGTAFKAAGVAVAAVGVAAVAGGVAAVRMAADFDKGMREVATLTPDVANNLDELKAGVLDLSRELGTKAVDNTKALYQAISAGVPAENALKFLRVASQAAIGGVTDTETAVDGLTTVMNAFKSQNIDVQRAADVMFATVKAGKTDFAQLSGALFNVAPLADATGVGFEEVSAALATLTAQGTPTSVATTQVRAAIQSLTKPSEALTEIFEAAGFASGEAAVKQLGFAGAADIVREATGGSVSGMVKLLGSIEGVQAILGTTGPNAEDFATNLEGMQNAAGAADSAFHTMEGGVSRTFDKLGATFDTVKIEIGEALIPAIQPLLKNLGELIPQALQRARGFFDTHGPAIQGVLARVGEIAGMLWDNFKKGIETILPVLQGFAQWLFDNKPVLIGIIAAIGLAIIAALGPVSLAVGAILGLVTVFGYVRDNWDEIRSKIEEIVGGIRDWIVNAFGVVVGWLEEHWPAIATIVSGPFALIVALATDAFGLRTRLLEAFGWIRDRAVEIWDNLVKGLTAFAANLRDNVVGFVGDLRDKVVGFFEGIIGKIGEFFGSLGEIPSKIKAAVKDVPVLGGLAQGVGNLFGFQRGGRFVVGGAGGADSQLVAFRATPGEIVTVTPPAPISHRSVAPVTGTVRPPIIIQVTGNTVYGMDDFADRVVEVMRDRLRAGGLADVAA